jgi:hypothetical protein
MFWKDTREEKLSLIVGAVNEGVNELVGATPLLLKKPPRLLAMLAGPPPSKGGDLLQQNHTGPPSDTTPYA